ncbi:hypothetical protein N7527_011458 [Penicillium freii]|nr:hypothetical protein N7527_011458 [Penicillium freii]
MGFRQLNLMAMACLLPLWWDPPMFLRRCAIVFRALKGQPPGLPRAGSQHHEETAWGPSRNPAVSRLRRGHLMLAPPYLRIAALLSPMDRKASITAS